MVLLGILVQQFGQLSGRQLLGLFHSGQYRVLSHFHLPGLVLVLFEHSRYGGYGRQVMSRGVDLVLLLGMQELVVGFEVGGEYVGGREAGRLVVDDLGIQYYVYVKSTKSCHFSNLIYKHFEFCI